MQFHYDTEQKYDRLLADSIFLCLEIPAVFEVSLMRRFLLILLKLLQEFPPAEFRL